MRKPASPFPCCVVSSPRAPLPHPPLCHAVRPSQQIRDSPHVPACLTMGEQGGRRLIRKQDSLAGPPVWLLSVEAIARHQDTPPHHLRPPLYGYGWKYRAVPFAECCVCCGYQPFRLAVAPIISGRVPRRLSRPGPSAPLPSPPLLPLRVHLDPLCLCLAISRGLGLRSARSKRETALGGPGSEG